MQILELTLGAEQKRPGTQQYASDTRSAFVKIAVHPGDNLDDVLNLGRDALARALRDAPGVTAAATIAPPRRVWRVTVTGPRAGNGAFRSLGMRWSDGSFVGEYDTATAADKARDSAILIDGNADVRILAPAPGA